MEEGAWGSRPGRGRREGGNQAQQVHGTHAKTNMRHSAQDMGMHDLYSIFWTEQHAPNSRHMAQTTPLNFTRHFFPTRTLAQCLIAQDRPSLQSGRGQPRAGIHAGEGGSHPKPY